MAFNLALAVTGAAMVRYVSRVQKWTRFAGAVLSASYAANFPLIMSLLSGNFGGFTKKATVNALVRDAFPAVEFALWQKHTKNEKNCIARVV